MIPSDLSIQQNNFLSTSRSSGIETAEQSRADVKEGNSPDVHKRNPDGWVKIDRSGFPFSNRQASTSNLNSVARTIRRADETMQEIGRHIDDMKSRLQTHVKNYPPFPPGSEERVKMLKSFSAFRRLIDDLTVPPDDDSAARIMNSAPAWDGGIVVEHKGFAKTIHSQPVGTGPDGIDIPRLSEAATDSDFQSMIGKLENAARTLESRRAGLQADANGIFNPPEA